MHFLHFLMLKLLHIPELPKDVVIYGTDLSDIFLFCV